MLRGLAELALLESPLRLHYCMRLGVLCYIHARQSHCLERHVVRSFFSFGSRPPGRIWRRWLKKGSERGFKGLKINRRVNCSWLWNAFPNPIKDDVIYSEGGGKMQQMFGLDGWWGGHCWTCYLVLFLYFAFSRSWILFTRWQNKRACTKCCPLLITQSQLQFRALSRPLPVCFRWARRQEWVYFERWGGEWREHRSSSLRRGFRGECTKPSGSALCFISTSQLCLLYLLNFHFI